jgi:hypothetical protein
VTLWMGCSDIDGLNLLACQRVEHDSLPARTRKHSLSHTHSHIHTHTLVYTCTHTRTHAHINTHTQVGENGLVKEPVNAAKQTRALFERAAQAAAEQVAAGTITGAAKAAITQVRRRVGACMSRVESIHGRQNELPCSLWSSLCRISSPFFCSQRRNLEWNFFIPSISAHCLTDVILWPPRLSPSLRATQPDSPLLLALVRTMQHLAAPTVRAQRRVEVAARIAQVRTSFQPTLAHPLAGGRDESPFEPINYTKKPRLCFSEYLRQIFLTIILKMRKIVFSLTPLFLLPIDSTTARLPSRTY